MGFQGTSHIYQYIGDTGRVQYATHAVIDELALHRLPSDRSPAAQILFGNESKSVHESTYSNHLHQELHDLEPGISPWLPEDQSLLELGDILPDETHGIILQYHANYNRSEIIGFEPLGAFARGLPNSITNRALRHLILAINGTDARSVDDVQLLLDGYVKSTHGRLSLTDAVPSGFSPSPILGVQVLLVKKPRLAADWVDSTFTFGAGDFSMLRSGFSVSSITSNPGILCPKSFGAAMRSAHRGEWLAALFSHLDNCHSIGTYGPRTIPPDNVTTLPAVLVLKHVINTNKQIDERKVRLCVNGSFQQKGIDYQESFAPTILAISIKVFIAVALHLRCELYHIDISNAFQNTPAPPNAAGQRLWLRIFPEYLTWYHARFPTQHAQLLALMHRHKLGPRNLGVEMFAHVQGRKDASREWGQHIDQVIFDELKLMPNRADSCIYQGIMQGHLVILARATDDILIATTHVDAYQAIVSIFQGKWKVHDMGIVEHYFGLRFVHSPGCLSIEQTHLVYEVLRSVFGHDWASQIGNKSDTVPMIAGTAHEEALAACIPYDASDLESAVKQYGFSY